VTKGEFPLSVDEVRAVLAALRVEAPALGRAEYGLDELLGEVLESHPELRAVDTHKLRRRFTIGGCMTELSDVRAGGATTRTIAIETEDPERVISLVRELGLDSRPNTSFPRGLKQLLGFGG